MNFSRITSIPRLALLAHLPPEVLEKCGPLSTDEFLSGKPLEQMPGSEPIQAWIREMEADPALLPPELQDQIDGP